MEKTLVTSGTKHSNSPPCIRTFYFFDAVFLQPVGFFPHLLSIIALFCILYTVFSKKF